VPDDASVAYFFFRDNDAKTQSIQQALHDMAYQLTQSDPVYAKYLATGSHSPGEIASVRTAWSTLFADYWLGDEGTGIAYLFLDGLDESFSAEREIIFELLGDVQDAGVNSRLRIVMLGRPHVVDELNMALGKDPPTIHVEPSKNGADIACYVEVSITKSRALNKVSKKLKAAIIETLTQKAGGMFMWVKLMIADLNRKAQRLRESDVQKALQQAPKGLTDMIKHVLEGYSSSISDEEASDLNDMLMWISLARRPLFLGELDAALRLKSEEGEGLIDLEGNLRKNYASLFTLSRDDGLTTAELLAPKRAYDDEEDTVAGADEVEGEDDLDFPSQFDSNPKTTTVSFSHASISDFFRDPKQGKVRATGDDCPEVGVNLEEAQVQIVRVCTDIIVDKKLRDRMKEAVSLASYAGKNWAEHLEQAEFKRATDEDKLAIGTNVARMMCDKELFPEWAGYRTYLYFTDDFAKPLLPWLRESILSGRLDSDISTQLRSINEDNALDIFEPVLRFSAQRWLAPVIGVEYSVKVVPTLIYSWQARKRGEVVQELPELTSERIISVAKWADLEENAEWHRRIAMTFRDFEFWDEAKKHFEKALELDTRMWMAQVGLAMLHYRRDEYDAAIKLYEAVLEAVEADTVHDEEFKNLLGRYRAHYDLAGCYAAMSGEIGKAFTRATFALDTKAIEHKQLAVKYKPTDYESFADCVYYYHSITQWDAAEDDETAGQDAKHVDMPDVPTNAECYQHIVQSARDLDGILRDDKHTNFIHSLMEFTYDVDDYHSVLSNAARETGELEWLQERYRAAIAAAKKDLQPVTAACLNLCLADILYKYGDQDRAMRIWESVGLESGQTTRVESEISYARWQALNKLGMHCITRAFEDESQADRWVEKMENIIARSHGRR
jgi:tetratricopeptide (TPR) repeat protein